MILEILFWIAVAGALYFIYTKAKAMTRKSSPEKGKGGGGGGGAIDEPKDIRPPKK